MNGQVPAGKKAARWILSLVTVTLSGLALAGCGKDLAPTVQQEPVYSRDSPPSFVRSSSAQSSDFLAATYYTVASGTVTKGKSKTIAGSRYSLFFASGSLTTSSLAVTVQEYDSAVIDFKLGPAGATFATPVSLKISYAGTNADPSSSNYLPGMLAFFYLDPVTNIWTSLPGTNNTTNKTYTISLASFWQVSSTSAGVSQIEAALARVPTPGTGDW